jgi:phage gp46-like protein
MVMGPNGGDLIFQAGDLVLTPGFQTAAILALLGGNEDDPGTGDASRSWWGNLGEDDLGQYRSATGNALASAPPTSQGLRRVQAALDFDLAFFVALGAASAVETAASMPARNRVALEGSIRAEGREESFAYVLNWKAQAEETAGVEIN